MKKGRKQPDGANRPGAVWIKPQIEPDIEICSITCSIA
jgi:hypothetical protein